MVDRGRDTDITIVTVCIEKHFAYVERQLALLDALNPGADWKMLVVDNSCADRPVFKVDNERCEVLAGVVRPQGMPDNYAGSYHHAAALNLGVRRASSRYVVILDPDLFVVYRNWMKEITEYCRIKSLAFFGVPWHYRWYTKYRYFPCVHFLLIDQHKVAAEQIDFTPAIDTARPALPWRLFKKTAWFTARARIGVSRDTGWRLGQLFRKVQTADVTLPILDIDSQLAKPAFLRTEWGRWGERRLPSGLSLLPRLGSYVEPKQAPGFASKAFEAIDAEMFVWRGAPFAFHLRRHVRDTVHGGTDRTAEDRLLDEVLDDAAKCRVWTDWHSERPGQVTRT